jgi:ubiquinone/menaquinone biosynthesis C-methylase UbiE
MSVQFICPVCKSSLLQFQSGDVICDKCHRTYPVMDGIPRFETSTVGGTKKESVMKFWNAAPNESLSVGAPKDSNEFFFETENKRYNQLHRDLGKAFLKEAIGFENYSGRKILEIGCGIGMDSIQFARSGNELTLLDLSFESLKITRERLNVEGYNASFVGGDSENLPFSDDQFDVVYSYGVIHHSPDTAKSVKEIFRVLKSGGEAIVMLYNFYSGMVFCNILINEGLRKGYFFKYWSLQELLNRRTELQSAKEDNEPVLTQAFSKTEIRKMFNDFSSLSIETHYLTPGMLAQLRHLLKVMPGSIKRRLPGWIGWNNIIRGFK